MAKEIKRGSRRFNSLRGKLFRMLDRPSLRNVFYLFYFICKTWYYEEQYAKYRENTIYVQHSD
jgi:hypothetical protein